MNLTQPVWGLSDLNIPEKGWEMIVNPQHHVTEYTVENTFLPHGTSLTLYILVQVLQMAG